MASNILDSYAEKHLWDWCHERGTNDWNDAIGLYMLIIDFVRDEPEFCEGKSWPEIRNAAESEADLKD